MYKIFEFSSKGELEHWLNNTKDIFDIVGYSVRSEIGYKYTGVSSTVYSVLAKDKSDKFS